MEETMSKNQRRIDTDKAILDAALNEIATSGYSNSKLSNIAQNAGISIGLIGQNFGSKEEMVIALIKRETTKIIHLFNVDDNLDWRALFSEVYLFIFNLYTQNIEGSRNYLKFFNTLLNGYDMPPSVLNFLRDFISRSYLLEALVEGQKKNEVKDGDPIRLVGLFYKTCITIFTHCQNFMIEPPKVEWFINVLEK